MPNSKSVFPTAGLFNNNVPAKIVLETGSLKHRFEFETLSGAQPTEQELISQYQIFHVTEKNGQRFQNQIDIRQATAGMRMIPGTYRAIQTVKGHTINLLPVEITEASHELLTFKLPPPVAFYGRVVNGITGDPIPNAFVIGYSSSRNGTFADLHADDWNALREIELANADDESLKVLQSIKGVQGLVRTNSNGIFKIVQPRNREFYGLIAFAESMLPYSVSVSRLKDRKTGKIKQRDYPLFPAAKVLVAVESDARISVNPHWVLEKEGQPEWVKSFEQATANSQGSFEYGDWLRLNESQPILVPAGLNLRMRFRIPYDEQFAPSMSEPFLLKPDETKDIGKVEFKATLPASVRIVDEKGNPVEGVPVRMFRPDENAWTVVRNSDADGIARFRVAPNSKGKFRAGETFGPGKVEPEFVDFAVQTTAPAKVFEIKLPAEKIRTILNSN